MIKLWMYILFVLMGNCCGLEGASKNDVTEKKVRRDAHPLLWRLPERVSSRDLFYGPGGREHQPQGPFVFVKEDTDGPIPSLKYEMLKVLLGA